MATISTAKSLPNHTTLRVEISFDQSYKSQINQLFSFALDNIQNMLACEKGRVWMRCHILILVAQFEDDEALIASALTLALSWLPIVLASVGSPFVVGIVLVAISLMLLLIALDGHISAPVRPTGVPAPACEDALPLLGEALSHDARALVEARSPLTSKGVVDWAWVRAGKVAAAVIKAAVAAMGRKVFIWFVLVEQRLSLPPR
jgi:hypothetical protein